MVDLDPASQDLDHITITLGCGHTFTVETLDGICDLAQAYVKDASTGRWTALSLAQTSFVKAASCPTCRRPVDARRYGRVTKRSNLDLLERNIATKMAKKLGSVQQAWATIDQSALEQAITLQISHRSQFTKELVHLERQAKVRDTLLSKAASSVVSLDVFDKLLLRYSGLPKGDAEQWKKEVKPLFQIYSRVVEILETRTAHTSAYEASFSMLYDVELHLAKSGPNPPQYPERYALRMAKLKVGMTPPRADTRFEVEGIWMTIDVRFTLGALAERVYSHLVAQLEKNPAQIDAWGNFTAFIYDTCKRDANIAFKIASSTQAHRQELLTSLRIIKAVWRSTQFMVIMKQSRESGLTGEERKLLTNLVEERLTLQKKNAATIRNQYNRNGGLGRDVIEREFDVPIREYIKNWEDLISTLKRPSVFYETVSEKEIRDVVGSFKEYSAPLIS
ncbi:hypothetical protein FRC17_000148 [Serendipita sp. 399]|nr:hypothetical protein FRC17_000148 [Serendipita sp. 399]